MQLFLEKVAPYILSLVATYLWWKFNIAFPVNDSVLSASLTLGAILTGFLATSKAILMTLDSPVMQRIRKTRYLGDLVSYIGQAIWLSFTFSIISLVGFFTDTSNFWFGLVWVFVGVSSAGCFIRVTNIMLKIIKYAP